jgi:hypothetical protein
VSKEIQEQEPPYVPYVGCCAVLEWPEKGEMRRAALNGGQRSDHRSSLTRTAPDDNPEALFSIIRLLMYG